MCLPAYMQVMTISYRPLRAALVGTCLTIGLTLPALGDGHMDYAEVSMMQGWRTADGTHIAAVRITLADGWHTYWRAPGDAGIPPRFDWSGSENVADIRVHWPTPSVYAQNNMRYVGYEGEVVLPVEITPITDGNIKLSGSLEFGVCDEICMPMSSEVSAVLTPDITRKTAPMIAKAMRDKPAPIDGVTCSAAPITDGMRIEAQVRLPSLGQTEAVVIEHPDRAVWVSEARVNRSGGTLSATSEMVPPTAEPFLIDRSALTITFLGERGAYEARGCKAG